MENLLCIGTGPNWPTQRENWIKKDVLATGLDIIKEFQPDCVRDILRGLPFSDDVFDTIIIEHVLEHVGGFLACEPKDNFVFIMNEMHRVLRPHGLLKIEVPYWQDDIAVEASGHVRFFAQNSFINFYENPYFKEMGMCKFSKVVNAEIFESGRSSEHPARVLKITLEK